MMWGWGWGSGWGWGWAWMLIMMVFWIAVIGVIVWAVLQATRQRSEPPARDRGAPGADPAVEILRRRFAAGEIDQDEFQRRLETLKRAP